MYSFLSLIPDPHILTTPFPDSMLDMFFSRSSCTWMEFLQDSVDVHRGNQSRGSEYCRSQNPLTLTVTELKHVVASLVGVSTPSPHILWWPSLCIPHAYLTSGIFWVWHYSRFPALPPLTRGLLSGTWLRALNGWMDGFLLFPLSLARCEVLYLTLYRSSICFPAQPLHSHTPTLKRTSRFFFSLHAHLSHHSHTECHPWLFLVDTVWCTPFLSAVSRSCLVFCLSQLPCLSSSLTGARENAKHIPNTIQREREREREIFTRPRSGARFVDQLKKIMHFIIMI